MTEHNVLMSSIQVRIENHFADMRKQFKFFKLTDKNRIGKSPVGLFFFCAVLFTNIKTIFKKATDLSGEEYLSWEKLNDEDEDSDFDHVTERGSGY